MSGCPGRGYADMYADMKGEEMAKTKKAVEPVEVDQKLLELAHDQRVELLEEWHRNLDRIAQGLSKYADGSWSYRPEDMEGSEPSSWKRIPRLAWLMARNQQIQHDLWYQASTRPLAPLWCVVCKGEFPGSPWLRVECGLHDASPSSAAALVGTFWNEKDPA